MQLMCPLLGRRDVRDEGAEPLDRQDEHANFLRVSRLGFFGA